MTALCRLLAFFLLLSLSTISRCDPKTTLVVFSGSENKALEALIQEFEQSSNVTVEMRYMGSLDIAHALEAGQKVEADAVWPADRVWIEQGDILHVVKNDASIMRSPVVLALKRIQGLGQSMLEQTYKGAKQTQGDAVARVQRLAELMGKVAQLTREGQELDRQNEAARREAEQVLTQAMKTYKEALLTAER